MMMGEFMLGARSRLLPPGLPFSFFGAAIVFHILAWATLAAGADLVPGFTGGPGLILAALHLLTLGVLTATAMGASFQLLPVATKRPIRSEALCRLSFWLLVPGVLALAWGLARLDTVAMHGGGAATVAALALFGLLIADNLRRVGDLPAVTRHAWLAMGSLAVLALLGLLLLIDFGVGMLPDHASAAAAHAVFAGYGFMGMLAMGFSYILVPMFALAQQPRSRLVDASVALAAAALAVAAAAALLGSGVLFAAAAACGLAATACHLRVIALMLRQRMRKQLGGAFVLIRLGWGLLPVSLAVGTMLALGLVPAVTAPLFGFLLIFGYLLSFVCGVLQRIMPFLASMHSVRPGIKPALVSVLTADRPLQIHLWCHLAALVLVSAGVVTGFGWLVRLGAAAGLAGAISFALFGVALWRRMILHLHANPPTAESTP